MCVTVVPRLYPMTFGNGVERHVPDNAVSGVDYEFYAVIKFGIEVEGRVYRNRGLSWWAVMAGA
jgi:hypothetical protein